MMFKTITATLAFGAGLCTANADTLSLQLLRTLAQESTGNLAFSPAGAENVLRALRQYSAGETLRELDALGIASPGTYNVHIEQADGLFVAQKLPLVPGIKEPVRVDFQHNQQAADTINNWCAKHTHNRITKLVQANDFSALTAFVATNAIYMKEKWQYAFNANDSFSGKFKTAKGKSIPVEMMSHTATYPTASGDNWVAIALPYATATAQGEPCYFIAIQPAGDARKFAAELTQKQYKDILSSLKRAHGKSQVVMPAFTIDSGTIQLNEALKQAGLKHIFSKADFSRLTTTQRDLYLSQVLQKCYVNVSEEGTEAAAATAAIVKFRSIGPRIPRIVLDRPFIWVIGNLSATDTPLFMGILQQP